VTRRKATICYLCGQPIGRDRTRDHVPPQSFFPESLRREKNFSKLDIVDAHKTCNTAYQRDEQYFFHSLAPLARQTQAGPAIWKTIDKPILTSHEWNLRRKIASEFYVDNNGQVRKTFEHDRLYRIAKKIVRGLSFLRWQTVMPDDWRYDCSIYDPVNRPPAPLLTMLDENVEWGEYPEIFFFKVIRSEAQQNQLWTLFFWDWAVIPVFVHETGCTCERCKPPIAIHNSRVREHSTT
jgi:hypothetical protein